MTCRCRAKQCSNSQCRSALPTSPQSRLAKYIRLVTDWFSSSSPLAGAPWFLAACCILGGLSLQQARSSQSTRSSRRARSSRQAGSSWASVPRGRLVFLAAGWCSSRHAGSSAASYFIATGWVLAAGWDLTAGLAPRSLLNPHRILAAADV